MQVAIATAYPIILDHLDQALSAEGHRVSAVLTRAGADPVSDRAAARGVPAVVLPTKPGEMSIARAARRDPTYAESVRMAVEGLRPAAIDVFVAWGINVLPHFVLDLAGQALNVHPSDLPKYRGGFPFQAQILNGERSMRLCVHRTTERIDAGAVLARSEEVPILDDDTMTTLVARAVPVGARVLAGTVSRLAAGEKLPGEPMPEVADVPHAWGIYRSNKSSGGDVANEGVLGRVRVEWDLDTSDSIARCVRAFDMMGGPYTNYLGDTWLMRNARILEESVLGRPGEILRVQGDEVDVQALDAVLRLAGRFAGSPAPELRAGELFTSDLPVSDYLSIPGADRVPAGAWIAGGSSRVAP